MNEDISQAMRLNPVNIIVGEIRDIEICQL